MKARGNMVFGYGGSSVCLGDTEYDHAPWLCSVTCPFVALVELIIYCYYWRYQIFEKDNSCIPNQCNDIVGPFSFTNKL